MAQFRATIQGNRKEASRLGTKDSGITATIDGWDDGVLVVVDHIDGKDVFQIYSSGGTNGQDTGGLIATIKDGRIVYPE